MKTKKQITIFSTGVHLQTEECIINGKKQWRWVAMSFEDDSFLDGEIINPIVYSDNETSLIEKFETD